MANNKDLSKEERVHKEVLRLRRIYKDLPKDAKALVKGLIDSAAFMKIQLEEYEQDLNENGPTEMFTQSPKTPPYERERPSARLYNSVNANYQKVIKQLSGYLAKDSTNPSKQKPNENDFATFVTERKR